MEFFDFPLSIREFPSCFQIAIIGRSEDRATVASLAPSAKWTQNANGNERKMQAEMMISVVAASVVQ